MTCTKIASVCANALFSLYRFKASKKVTLMSNSERKDPFNIKYFLAFVVLFVVVGCLNAILGWATLGG